jgi:hypothetical protein
MILATQSGAKLPLIPVEGWLLSTLCDVVGVGRHTDYVIEGA